jgi:hypothetical protein
MSRRPIIPALAEEQGKEDAAAAAAYFRSFTHVAPANHDSLAFATKHSLFIPSLCSSPFPFFLLSLII